MAASGSTTVNVTFTASGAVADALKFSWWENTQSVSGNTTQIGWKLELIAYQYGYISSSAKKDWSVTVNGLKYSGTNTVGISANSTKTLASSTTNIKHNDDGKKTFSYSFSQYFGIDFNGTVGTKSGSGSGTLTTISRASQPSCITYPDHTQNVGEFGDTISIHMNRASSDFTHKVRYAFGSQTGTCIDAETGEAATSVTNGFKWTIPLSLMNLIPATTSGSGTIYVDTYNGTTKIGTKSCGFTATVPASVKPLCGFSLTDVTGADDIYGSPVKGISKIEVDAYATLAYDSPIQSYRITANGVSYNQATITTGVLKTAGSSVVTVTVTDKRGRSGTSSYTMTVQDYSKPAISKLVVQRCDASGTAAEQGGYIKATFSASVSSMSGKNTASYVLKYKKAADSTYTEIALTDLANNYAPTNYSKVFAATANATYEVIVVATDRHGSTTRSANASTAFALVNWHKSGTGMGIGKVAEKEKNLQVGLDAEFDGNVKTSGNHFCFSSPGVAGSAGYVRMVQLTHKKANADTPITFVFTRRLCPHPMTVHVQFRTDSTTIDPDLKNITYEGNNYGAFLVRAQESVWDLYVEKVSAYDTITLQTWFSSSTVTDRLTVEFPGDLVASVPTGLDGFYRATPAKLDSLLDHIYPVGSIYLSYSHTSPADLFGGTWERIENAFLWATDESGTIGQTGGEKTHTLTEDEMPKHTHGFRYTTDNGETYATAMMGKDGTYTSDEYLGISNSVSALADYRARIDYAGSGGAHNNMPPYIQVSAWRRTA